MVKLTKIAFITLISTSIWIACAPQNKEAYLNKYENFIQEVKNSHKNYSDEDWQKADEQLEKFTGDWYQKFKENLSLKEQIALGKYILQYNMYRYSNDFNDIKEFFNSKTGKLKEKIKHYQENEMEQDMEELIKEAKKAGDSAVIVLKEIFEELDIEFPEK